MVTIQHDPTPLHVAIIMDGNRRWARQKGLPAVMGHKKVVEERLEELIEYAASKGIAYLTLWAFSTENWRRNGDEVGAMMDLFRWALRKKAAEVIERGARIRCIGDLTSFPEDIRRDFEKVMKESAQNDKITVVLALNYGGRDELLRAFSKLLREFSIPNFQFPMDEHLFSNYLDTMGMPDVDLIIRTSGEQRLSGFMPWQSVYSELYFTNTLMPDFGKEELQKALDEFACRKRRYGQ
jgi:undecaprenyl diphosphate synthase